MNVGTEGEVQARVAASREWPSVELTAADLEPALLKQSQLEELGFLLEIPRDWGPGGERVSELDATTRCERCETDFQVRRDPSENECQYHWGRIWSRKDEGIVFDLSSLGGFVNAAALSREEAQVLHMLSGKSPPRRLYSRCSCIL